MTKKQRIIKNIADFALLQWGEMCPEAYQKLKKDDRLILRDCIRDHIESYFDGEDYEVSVKKWASNLDGMGWFGAASKFS